MTKEYLENILTEYGVAFTDSLADRLLKEFEPCEDMVSRGALEQEPKTGHWVFVDKAHEHAHCSECDYGNVDLLDGRPHNYCPNCGCRMVEPQESEDKE